MQCPSQKHTWTAMRSDIRDFDGVVYYRHHSLRSLLKGLRGELCKLCVSCGFRKDFTDCVALTVPHLTNY